MIANTSTYPYHFHGIKFEDTHLLTKSGFRIAACCSAATGWDTGCKQYRNKTYVNSKLQAKDEIWYYFRKHTCDISYFG